GVSLRAARRGDRRAALGVDTRAFPPVWRLDGPGLADAVTATPDARFRVARAGRQVVGYAVTGRAGTTGYLQRLAVDPAVEGRGIGRVLVVDGVQWVRRGGGTQVVVNTQVDNNRALDLYRSVGFELLPSGLRVLGRSLAGDDPAVDRAAVDDREGADGAGPGHR
ncbi:MAG: GNAT family N-acetyltransferase, partial [Acidimicrobiia bacterium]